MGEPIAYLLTWTTYGTWLHGDPRGSVDYDHNIHGEAPLEPNPHRFGRASAQMPRSAVALDKKARMIVHEAIAQCCAFRGWRLHALNVRSNHVHVVVEPMTLRSPESILVQMKAWSTRRLREGGSFTSEQRLWTTHGSTRYLWNEKSVLGAIDYVLLRQEGETRTARA